MDKYDIELQGHKFILFCVDSYNSLGALRSLGEKNITSYTILWENKGSYLLKSSKYLGPIKTVSSIQEGYEYLMSEFSSEEKKPFIITCDDKIESFIDNHYDELIDKFYFFHGNKQGIINYYMDKAHINQLAEKCGFTIPKAEVLERGVLPQNLNYPIITKTLTSNMGAWKADSFICNTPEELKIAYDKIKAPKLIVEEYIKKETEFCYDAFCINEGMEVCIPYQSYYLRAPHDSYGCFMEQRPFNDKALEEKVSSLLQIVGYTGVFEIEFLVGLDKTVYFLEVNFRNSGWSHAATFGGINMPYQWAKSIITGNLNIDGCKRRPLFTAMIEPADFINSVVKEKQVTLWQWLNDVKRCDYFYYYNKKDKKPFFKMLFKNISIKNIKKRV